MIDLLIFDMDGTLIELKDVHYEALNRALGEIDPEFVISREEHETKYNGLPTKKKLEMLTEDKGLCSCDYEEIWKRKQDLTIKVINETLVPTRSVCDALRQLRFVGFKIVVASNSIKETIRVALEKADLMQYVHNYFSNEDVVRAKPDPEMFLMVMNKYCVSPKQTMIFEDSPVGIAAAAASGAWVYKVNGIEDIDYDATIKRIYEIEKYEKGSISL